MQRSPVDCRLCRKSTVKSLSVLKKRLSLFSAGRWARTPGYQVLHRDQLLHHTFQFWGAGVLCRWLRMFQLHRAANELWEGEEAIGGNARRSAELPYRALCQPQCHFHWSQKARQLSPHWIEDAQDHGFEHQHLSSSDWKQENSQAFQLPRKVKKKHVWRYAYAAATMHACSCILNNRYI